MHVTADEHSAHVLLHSMHFPPRAGVYWLGKHRRGQVELPVKEIPAGHDLQFVAAKPLHDAHVEWHSLHCAFDVGMHEAAM